MDQTQPSSQQNERFSKLSVEELQALIDRLTFIQRIGSEFASTLQLNVLMDKVLEEVIHVLQAEAGSIWLVDPQRQEIACYIAKGATKDKVQNLRLKQGQGIVGSVALNKEAKLVSDVQNDPNFSGAVDKASGFVTRSMICAPILAKGESLGSIQVINKLDPNALFQENDLELLSILATNAGVAIKNAQLYAAEKKAKELSAILEISKEITSTLDIQQVLFTIVNLASRVIEYDRCAIALEHQGKFELSAVSGEEELIPSNYPALTDVLTWAGSTGREVWIADKAKFLQGEDIPDEFRTYFDKEEMHALWLVPLKDEEGTLGALIIEGKTPNFIANGKFQMLTILVNQTTVAIRNAQLYSSVPMGNVLEKLRGKKGALGGASRLKWLVRLAAAAVVIGLMMIPLPYRVAGDASVHPALRSAAFSQISGTILSIPSNIREGSTVKTGDLLATIDDTEYSLRKINLTAQLRMLERSLPQLQSSLNIASYKQNQLKLEQVRADLAYVDFQLANCEIRATGNGTILTPDIEEQAGSTLSPGAPFCEIADLENIRVDIDVPEEDLGSVAIGSTIQLKVKAYPLYTFEGVVIAIAQEPHEMADRQAYAVRAEIQNLAKSETTGDFSLKPGMTGRAKIQASNRMLGLRLFGGLIRAVQMKLWI
jgi:GAF domain-containing protein